MAKKKRVSKKRILEAIDPVYVPIDFDAYRRDKANVLNAQIKVLECVKTIDRIRELQRVKSSLKLDLYKILADFFRLCAHLCQLLPPINNINLIRQAERSMEITINYTQRESYGEFSGAQTRTDELDSELREIQKKLDMLNGSRASA
jgi:hypothetical protein